MKKFLQSANTLIEHTAGGGGVTPIGGWYTCACQGERIFCDILLGYEDLP